MARSFNGVSDVVNCGGASGVFNISANGKIAISAWVNFGVIAANATICAKDFDGTTTPYQLIPSSATALAFQSFNGTTHGATVTPAGLTTGKWFHVYGDYDGATWHVVVNGTSSGSSTDPVGPQSNSQPLTIGAFANANNPLNGIVAEVGIWNTNLGLSGDVIALASGVRCYNIRPKNLIGYWTLDGLQSPEPDLSGNKNNGTVTGTAFASGPPLMMSTPRTPSAVTAGAISSSVDSRRSLAQLGTRVGSRQQHAVFP